MAKKSRRTRRQESQKQPKPTSPPQPLTAEAPAPVVEPAEPAPVTSRKGIDFAQEYFHVYFDTRNVLIISVLMFVVLIALSFAI
jgi:hypothetical protein